MLRVHHEKEPSANLNDLICVQESSKDISNSRMTENNSISENNNKNSHQNSIIYDDFFYTDKLTNKKIKMRDAKTSYENGRHYRHITTPDIVSMPVHHEKRRTSSKLPRKSSSQQIQKQLTDLNECFLMIKSTEMFKLNSLREKIFKAGGEKQEKQTNRKMLRKQTKNGQNQKNINELLRKKKKIRQIMQDSMKQASLQQFRKCFKNAEHKINPKIVEMNRQLPTSFNKTNIEKIISTLNSPDKEESKNKKHNKIDDEDVEFPGEQKLRSDLLGYMKRQIRQNGEYLIVPEKNKVLFQKLYNNVNSKNGNIPTQKAHQEQNRLILNSINTTPDQSTFGVSRVFINIPSQKTILDQFEQKEIAKTNPIQKYDQQIRQNKKRQKTWMNCQFLQPENKQNSQLGSFLKEFSFTPFSKYGEISKIKQKFEKNKKFSSKRLNLQQQKFLFLVENRLLFDVEKQILMNENYLFLKDNNENNLLHLCAKNHSTEMFLFVVERLKKCEGRKEFIQKWGNQLLRNRLMQKNKHNKTVFEVARIYHAEEILEILMRLKDQLNIWNNEL